MLKGLIEEKCIKKMPRMQYGTQSHSPGLLRNIQKIDFISVIFAYLFKKMLHKVREKRQNFNPF